GRRRRGPEVDRVGPPGGGREQRQGGRRPQGPERRGGGEGEGRRGGQEGRRGRAAARVLEAGVRRRDQDPPAAGRVRRAGRPGRGRRRLAGRGRRPGQDGPRQLRDGPGRGR